MSHSIRRAIIPFNKHSELISIDFANIEYRLLAHFSKDPELLRIFRSGEDFHGQVAKSIGVDRAVAKTFNFAQLYGAGAKRLSVQTGIPVKKCEGISALYYRTYKNVQPFKKSVIRFAERHGGVRNPFGRWRVIPRDRSYMAVNTLIQSTAADILKIALIKVWKLFQEEKWESSVLFPVHDEIVFNWEHSDGDIVTPIVTAMQDFAVDGKDIFRVPITVDVCISPANWADKKEVGFQDYMRIVFSKDEAKMDLLQRFQKEPHKKMWLDFLCGLVDSYNAFSVSEEFHKLLVRLERAIEEGESDKKFEKFLQQWAKDRNIFLDEVNVPALQGNEAFEKRRTLGTLSLLTGRKNDNCKESIRDGGLVKRGKKQRKSNKNNKAFVKKKRKGRTTNRRKTKGKVAANSTGNRRKNKRRKETVRSKA